MECEWQKWKMWYIECILSLSNEKLFPVRSVYTWFEFKKTVSHMLHKEEFDLMNYIKYLLP